MRILLTQTTLAAAIICTALGIQSAQAAKTCLGHAGFEYIADVGRGPVWQPDGIQIDRVFSGTAHGMFSRAKRRRACRKAARSAFKHIVVMSRAEICRLARQKINSRFPGAGHRPVTISKVWGYGKDGSMIRRESKRIRHRCT